MNNQLTKSLLISFFVIIGFFSFTSPTFAQSFPEIPDYVKAPYFHSQQGSSYEGWYSKLVVFQASSNDRYYACKVSADNGILRLANTYQNGNKLAPIINSTGQQVIGETTYNYSCLDAYHYYNDEWTKTGINTSGGATYLPIAYSISSRIWSETDVYFGTIGSNPTNYGANYDSIGSVYYNQLLLEANYSHSTGSAPAETPSVYPFFIEYTSPPKIGTVLLVSRQRCFLPLSSPDSLLQPIECPSGPNQFIEYSVVDGVRTIESTTSHTWEVFTPLAPNDYCSALISSNYTLSDTNGNPICRATVNPRIAEIAPPFSGVISFDPANQDWGAFEWFEQPVSLFVGIINDVVGWFYDLYVGFLNVVVPNPETLTWFTGSIRAYAEEKFGSIDLTSLTALQDVSASSMSNITIYWRGQTMTLINFDLLKANIDIIRPVLVASVGLFIIIFNVNMLNKLLSDEDITSV